ncbi:MAG: hypothetical protein H8K07_07095 [Nitrospira sp.]|nr:hypothetical protein [Nitrospira sp.]
MSASDQKRVPWQSDLQKLSRVDVAGIPEVIGATGEAELKMVPRDRIELSTPAFSGQEESEQDQIDKLKTQCKQ